MPVAVKKTTVFPLCLNKGCSVSKRLIVSPHPAWQKWNKLYPTVEAWCKANPGKPAGKVLSGLPKDVVYYSYTLRNNSGIRRFNYSFQLGSVPRRPVPEDATIYETFQEWDDVRLGRDKQTGKDQ